jgi:NAD(P)-dependent dehydrogenase (short-subunit alcohol dehydrogenase family)
MGGLTNKTAVIYGGGGAIGGAVARAFAREGANVFLTGRRRASTEMVAKDIVLAGGMAEAAEVDALDEEAIDRHLQSVTERAAHIDISFNAVSFPIKPGLGIPMTALNVDDLSMPVTNYARTYFLTSRLAARRMIPNKSGVIMTLSAPPARIGYALSGGYGASQAAKEALTRDFSAELAAHRIRVVTLCSYAVPDTNTVKEIYEGRAKSLGGITWEQWLGYLTSATHTKRAMTLTEVADVAAFVASDKASGMTGTIVNLSMGSIPD